MLVFLFPLPICIRLEHVCCVSVCMSLHSVCVREKWMQRPAYFVQIIQYNAQNKVCMPPFSSLHRFVPHLLPHLHTVYKQSKSLPSSTSLHLIIQARRKEPTRFAPFPTVLPYLPFPFLTKGKQRDLARPRQVVVALTEPSEKSDNPQWWSLPAVALFPPLPTPLLEEGQCTALTQPRQCMSM